MTTTPSHPHKIQLTTHSTLLQTLQSLFDDLTLYNDTQMRNLVRRSAKGFVPIHELLQLPVMREFVERNPTLLVTPDAVVQCVRDGSRKLVVVNYRVRRIEPFVDEIGSKKLTPIYVDRLPNKSTEEICQFFKNLVGVVYQIYHKKVQKWAIIVIPNYESLQPYKDQIYFQGTKLSILNPLQTLTSYSDNERLSSDFNIIKLYENKNMWQFPDQNEQDLDAEVGQGGGLGLGLELGIRDKKDIGRGMFGSRKNLGGERRGEDLLQGDGDGDGTEFEDCDGEIGFIRDFGIKGGDYLYHKNMREVGLSQRAKNLQARRIIQSEINKILNYDNTPLLQLKQEKMVMEQQ